MSIIIISCFSAWAMAADYTIDIEQKFPHPNRAFTQGIIINDGTITEASGLYNKSFIQRFKLGNSTSNTIRLPGHYFAEGLTQLKDEIFVLTWKENTVLVFDANNLTFKRRMQYSSEGWGLTHNGKQLIMSDGSARISFRNPTSFFIESTLPVTEDNAPLKHINELEWVDGELYANIWQTDDLVVIDSSNGKVIKRVDLSPMRQQIKTQRIDVINGIAWDNIQKKLYLTGKFWPAIFQVNIIGK